MLRILAACFALAATLAFAADAPAPPPMKLRVLFIGNSLTSRGDIPARFEKLAEAMGRKAVVDTVASDNYSLEDHWRDGRAVEAIKKGWDIVVLQQDASSMADGRAQLVEYTKRFAKPIREAGARPALFQAWPTMDKMRDMGAGIAAYRAAAEAVDGIVLPVCEVWLRALGVDKRLRLYSDVTQAASFGNDLAVLTIYLALFPAGHYEFTEEFVAKAAKALEIPAERRDPFFDAVTLAIDEPMPIK
jgi:hypothetical protein